MAKAAGIAAAALIALLPTTAHAASSRDAAVTHPNFAAQARSAGLTATQEAGLQAKVDSYLAKTGGTQISPNQIKLQGQGVLVVAVPGDTYAKDLSTPGTVHPNYTCPYLDLCVYSGTSYSGDFINWYYCQLHYAPYITVGSFKDNQSAGTVSVLYLVSGTSTTFRAPLNDPDIDWKQVYEVKVC